MSTAIHLPGLEKAIRNAGSASALAIALGLATNTPSMWRRRGSVPAEHCPDIEDLYRVPCEEIRPDVSWHVLRRSAAPAQSAQAA